MPMFDLKEGRTVAQIMEEVRERKLTAVFALVRPENTFTNKSGESTGGFTLRPLSAGEVEDDWSVWDAEPVKAGVVRLLVTRAHLARNPIYSDWPPVATKGPSPSAS